MGRKRKSGVARGGAPTRRKGKTAELVCSDDHYTFHPTGSEASPNSEVDEPQVEGIVKVELEPEEGPPNDVNYQHEEELRMDFNQVAEIDIGLFEVKVLQYPEDKELVLQVEVETGPYSNTTNFQDSTITNLDTIAADHRTATSKSKSSEDQVDTNESENFPGTVELNAEVTANRKLESDKRARNLEANHGYCKDKEEEKERRVNVESRGILEPEVTELTSPQSNETNSAPTTQSSRSSKESHPSPTCTKKGGQDQDPQTDTTKMTQVDSTTEKNLRGSASSSKTSANSVTNVSLIDKPVDANADRSVLDEQGTIYSAAFSQQDSPDKEIDQCNDDDAGIIDIDRVKMTENVEAMEPIIKMVTRSQAKKPERRGEDDAPQKIRNASGSNSKSRNKPALRIPRSNNPCSKDMSGDSEDKSLTMEEHIENTNKKPERAPFPGLITKIQPKLRTKVGTPAFTTNPKTEKHKCPICEKEFTHKSNCRRHYKSVHLKMRFQCGNCGKEFKSKRNCKLHQETAHAGIRYACHVCSKLFTATCSIRLHQLSTDCGEKLRLGNYPPTPQEVVIDNVQGTKLIKGSSAKLINKIQPKSLASVETPVSSINPKTRKHICDICSMEFSSNVGFQNHSKSVHLKVRFKCTTCGKKFISNSNCHRHQRTAHVGVRFKCQVCSRPFSKKEYVEFHQRTTDCGKKLSLGGFPSNPQKVTTKVPQKKRNPKSVIRIEGKSRRLVGTPEPTINPETGKYKCNVCIKEFVTRQIFRRHFDCIHLNVRFKCVTCGRTFTSQAGCKLHQNTVHDAVRYACQVCNKSFKRTDAVRDHQKRSKCGKKLARNSTTLT